MTSTEAFVPGPRTQVPGAAAGPLAGLTFAVKDLIDVAGVPTGGGNPDWPRFAPTPTRHAWVVQTLLDAGASVVGKTITDEVSLGILGENAHDGTPLNPARPAACRAARRADRPRRWLPGPAISRWAPIPAARCACRRAFAAFTASGRRMGGSISPALPCRRRAAIPAAGLRAMPRRSRAFGEVMFGAPCPHAAHDAAGGRGRLRLRG